jgi:hypothetical protein
MLKNDKSGAEYNKEIGKGKWLNSALLKLIVDHSRLFPGGLCYISLLTAFNYRFNKGIYLHARSS